MPDQERIYIGNVVLDESNQEMLKQWLLDIIDALQGHGHGFDADTVDGYHADAFATYEQGQKADTALQSGILIGSSALYNIVEAQYIKTDGVKLDDTVYNTLVNYINNLTEGMLLSDFLVALYADYTARLDGKVDKIEGKGLSTEDFTTQHKEIVENIALCYEEVLCPKDSNPSQQTIKRVLNAGSVNHLQFILTTESLYAQYTNEVKNAWNNVFIFVEEEFYPDDYESPLDCPIETGYVFRIDDDNPERPGEVWLQYKGKNARNWLDLIQINDLYSQFVRYGNFENIMEGIANRIVEAAIGEIDTPEHLNALIKSIDAPGVDDWDSYPFWSRQIDFVYDVVNGDHSFCREKNADGFVIADIGSLTNEIEGEVDQLQNDYSTLLGAVNSIKTNYVKKAEVQSQLNTSSLPASSNAVKSVTDTITAQCNELSSRMSNLQTSVDNLLIELNRAKYFQKYIVLGVGRYKGKRNPNFVTPTDQKQDTLGAYEIQETVFGTNIPTEAKFIVSNKGHATRNTTKDPDYIYARLIQEHTGEPATEDTVRYMFFQINGVNYVRYINPGTDYATLNINLPPGKYVITALYIDTIGPYQHPIYMTQELIVEDLY